MFDAFRVVHLFVAVFSPAVMYDTVLGRLVLLSEQTREGRMCTYSVVPVMCHFPSRDPLFHCICILLCDPG